MTAPDLGLENRVAALCPGFVASARPRRLRKSEVIAGRIGDRAVFAKRLAKPSQIWAWYFAREVAIYRRFAAEAPGFHTPRLVACDADLLVIEHLPGAPLATRRRPAAAVSAHTLAAVIAACEQIAAWPPAITSPPPPRVRAQLRERLLEDPTDAAWIADGARVAARRGLVSAAIADAIAETIGRSPPTVFAHGDLLLRNVLADGDGVAVVDWECAGIYPRDWDLALVWTQLAPAARPIVEAAVPASRRPAFRALVAFALVRELRFLAAFGADARLVEAELAAAVSRL